MNICKVDKCKSKHYSNGYCQRHYKQVRRGREPHNTTRTDGNPIKTNGDITEIGLRKKDGSIIWTLIDTDDLERIREHNWSMCGDYVRTYNPKNLSDRPGLHNIIMGSSDKNRPIDHINRNRLDNRKCNLRFVTPMENSWNKDSKNYHWSKQKNKWRVRIIKNGKDIHIGFFEKEEDAKKAGEEAKLKYHSTYTPQGTPEGTSQASQVISQGLTP